MWPQYFVSALQGVADDWGECLRRVMVGLVWGADACSPDAPTAGTAGILELPDDVMVYILQHVEDGKTLLVVIPSVGEPGQPGPDGFF